MLFFPILASFFAFGAMSAVASPAPIVDAVEKRQDANVLAILDTLQAQTNSILPQIDDLVNSDKATVENISPLAEQLVAALNTGGASLEAIKGRVFQDAASTDEAAQRTAEIYTSVAKCVGNVKTKKPHLYPVFPHFGLEAALIKILLGLEILLVGVIKLVALLLKAVGGLLTGLGWLLLLGKLGY